MLKPKVKKTPTKKKPTIKSKKNDEEVVDKLKKEIYTQMIKCGQIFFRITEKKLSILVNHPDTMEVIM